MSMYEARESALYRATGDLTIRYTIHDEQGNWLGYFPELPPGTEEVIANG
jgi:hypothetical protein